MQIVEGRNTFGMKRVWYIKDLIVADARYNIIIIMHVHTHVLYSIYVQNFALVISHFILTKYLSLTAPGPLSPKYNYKERKTF